MMDPELDTTIEPGVGDRHRLASPSQNRRPGAAARASASIAGEKSRPEASAAAVRRGDGEETGTAGQIEHAHAGADPGGVEDRLAEGPRRIGKGRQVCRRGPFPADVLELTHLFRVETHAARQR